MTENLTQGEDPTKTVLSESALNKKSLCDYVINVATGCRHGLKELFRQTIRTGRAEE